MQAIWKVQLAIVDEQTVSLPTGMQPLCVQTQRGEPCLWARCQLERPMFAYKIYCYGTGHKHEVIRGKYLGTVQLPSGLVFHFFIHDVGLM